MSINLTDDLSSLLYTYMIHFLYEIFLQTCCISDAPHDFRYFNSFFFVFFSSLCHRLPRRTLFVHLGQPANYPRVCVCHVWGESRHVRVRKAHKNREERSPFLFSPLFFHIKSWGKRERKGEDWERRGDRKNRECAELWVEWWSEFGHWISSALQSLQAPDRDAEYGIERWSKRDRKEKGQSWKNLLRNTAHKSSDDTKIIT